MILQLFKNYSRIFGVVSAFWSVLPIWLCIWWPYEFFFFKDVQTELHMKFSEFSDKVFAIFLQDPDDVKTFKMADDLLSEQRKQRKHKAILSI